VNAELARELMAECLELGAAANRAAEVAMRLSDQKEREAVLRSIGSINDLVYMDLMRPIIKEHPELDPDR
jgi:hypothetical protein